VTKVDVYLVSSGYSDGPAQALCKWLTANQVVRSVVLITHPLNRETNFGHNVHRFDGDQSSTKKIERFSKPPYTYIFDFFSPVIINRGKVWIGFNCLATVQGLILKKLRRVDVVIHWNVDFVPRRYESRLLNTTYCLLDKISWKRCDAHVELTENALNARSESYGISTGEKDLVIPMGTWFNSVPKIVPENHEKQRIIFVGHLVERMGLIGLIEEMKEVHKNFPSSHLLIVGDGPLLSKLKELATLHGLESCITFTGYVEDVAEVDRLLAESTLAVAPYLMDDENFSQFADPGKLKMYLGAGLPILTTNIAPFSQSIFDSGAGFQIEQTQGSISSNVHKLFNDNTLWSSARSNALDLGSAYDWPQVFGSSGLLRYLK
jgi:glycosyltransferase involved in cell wall biosynthesis